MRVRISALLAVAAVVSLATVVGATVSPAPAAAAPATGSYVAVKPTRLLDTRATGNVGPGRTVVLTVRGAGPVPASGVAAVALNVTVAQPTSSGNITVYPHGVVKPNASNLNFVRGQTVPNLVVVAVGSDGKVALTNSSAGTVRLVADVEGHYTGDGSAPTAQGAFGSVVPTRVLDTRKGIGAPARPLGPNASLSFRVTGAFGATQVPSGVSAVVINLTATASTGSGYVTAYADGSARPTASNVNYLKGQTVPNLVVAPVGSNGRVRLTNISGGSVHLIADIAGYFLAGDPTNTGKLGALRPVRLLDTRSGNGAPRAAVGSGRTISVRVTGRGGVPLTHVSAVVLNVTVTQPTAVSGSVTVYGDAPRPTTSNLNFVRGQTVPNLVMAPVSSTGTVSFYNGSAGTVHLLADVSGYVLSTDLPVPNVSTSRYVRSVTGAFTHTGTDGSGCADAHSGSTFILLDIGAQLNDKTGVALTVVGTPVTYANLVAAIDNYLTSYHLCLGAGTVAVGTNNGANDWTHYTAAQRGADWANKVVDAISPVAGVTVQGANDIESGFFSTQAQAQAWESAFLGATGAKLVFNGSADGCPTAYGATGGTCNFGWTEAQYYTMAHGLSPSRILALPQVYYPAQAVQWANIDATGGKQMVFAGSLTEHGSACGADCAMTPAQGWATLYHALSTIMATPSLPAIADLLIES